MPCRIPLEMLSLVDRHCIHEVRQASQQTKYRLIEFAANFRVIQHRKRSLAVYDIPPMQNDGGNLFIAEKPEFQCVDGRLKLLIMEIAKGQESCQRQETDIVIVSCISEVVVTNLINV